MGRLAPFGRGDRRRAHHRAFGAVHSGLQRVAGVQFPGIGDIQSLEDFIVSNNVLPLGGLVYVLFCTSRYGWGWKNFLTEANTGAGPRFRSGRMHGLPMASPCSWW